MLVNHFGHVSGPLDKCFGTETETFTIRGLRVHKYNPDPGKSRSRFSDSIGMSNTTNLNIINVFYNVMFGQNNLNDILDQNRNEQFKSGGERKIAYFLDETKIRYQYEKPVMVNSIENKTRIWYPDFYLPEFKTYIEYYGYAGNYRYDQSIKTKQSVYSKMGLDVISFYPWMFADNWKGYIIGEIKNNIKLMENKIRTIEYRTSIKPHYRSRSNPYKNNRY